MNGIFVFIGGGFGALVRYLLCLILPKISYFPAGTLISNFLGCFIAAFVFLTIIAKSDMNSFYKTFLIVGFCGGLSTLSALSLELLEFIRNGEYLRAFAYTVTTVAVCTMSILLALVMAKNSINLKL